LDILLLCTALFLLAAPGLLSASLIISGAAVSRWSLAVGYGLLAGLVGIPVIIRLLDSAGLSLSFGVTGSVVGGITLALLVARFRSGGSLLNRAPVPAAPTSLARADKLLMVVFLGLIALRIATLGIELAWRPLFPFDATMHWATKSRVWFEHFELTPFVENSTWLELRGQGVYTDHHPGYPITIPLLQFWISSAIGRWDESLINLPWLFCIIALGAAFYGQAREAGAGAPTSLCFTYLLLSLPLLDSHVALAGYADLFLGACYCLAVMAFYNWSVTRRPWQAILTVFFALSCPLIKNEGFFWLLTFFPALLVVLLPGRKALGLLLFLVLASITALVEFPRDMVVAGHSLEELNLHFRPDALRGVFDSLYVHDSWHLFAWLLTGLIVLALWLKPAALNDCAGVAVALGAAASLFLVLFLFTGYSVGAVRFTAVGRISLHLVPALMFFCLLLFHKLQLLQRAGRPATLAADGSP